MRRISLHMFMTFDGYAYFPTYPTKESLSSVINPLLKDMWVKHFDSIDTVILGRKAYGEWANYWPLYKRKESDTAFNVAFSKFVSQVNKIVISNTLKNVDWEPTRIMNGDFNEIVSQLRKEPGKNIALGGGAMLAQEFINLDLIDDYYLTVFPVILGNSIKDANRLFDNIQNQKNLVLQSVNQYKDGEFVLHYETQRKTRV